MSDYPSWICTPCGHKHGRKAPTWATWHLGLCGWCGQQASVTEPRDYGYLPFPTPLDPSPEGER